MDGTVALRSPVPTFYDRRATDRVSLFLSLSLSLLVVRMTILMERSFIKTRYTTYEIMYTSSS